MTLQLPAPERYKDWRVLSEDEKQGEATGEEMCIISNPSGFQFIPMTKGNCNLPVFDTIIVPPDYGKQQEPERNADVPVRFDPKCMGAHIFARAAIGAGDMLKVTDGNKTRWCNSCDSVSVWHNRAQYSYPYFAWDDLLVERKTRAEYEQEIGKGPKPTVTSESPCSVCGGKRWRRGDVLDGYMIVPCYACNILGDVRPVVNDWPNMMPCDFKTHNT